jgi:hypothetical protein
MTEKGIRFIPSLSSAGILLVFGIFGPEATGQTERTRTPLVPVPVLRAPVVATNVDEKLVWAWQRQPEAGDVIATDPPLKQGLQRSISALRQGTWLLKKGGDFDFGTALRANMKFNGFTITLQPPAVAPTSMGQTSDVDLTAVISKDAVQEREIEISIVVNHSDRVRAHPVRTTAGELHRGGHFAAIGLPPEALLSDQEKKIPVTVTAPDSNGSGTGPVFQSSEHSHAYAVAGVALKATRDHQLSLSAPFDPRNPVAKVRTDITKYLLSTFELVGGWEIAGLSPNLPVDVTSAQGVHPWKIEVPLVGIKETKFELTQIRLRNVDHPLSALTEEARNKLAEKKQEQERKVQQAVPELQSLKSRLLSKPEFDQVSEKIVSRLEKADHVADPLAAANPDGTLAFTGTWLPNDTEITAGIGFSTDKGVNGTINFSSFNTPFHDNDAFQLSITAGTEKSSGTLSYQLPYYRSANGAWSADLNITGDYAKDTDSKLGVPNEETHDEEKWNAEVRNVLRNRSEKRSQTNSVTDGFQPSRRQSTRLETAIGLSSVTLQGIEGIEDLSAEEGRFGYFLVEAGQQWTWEIRDPDKPGFGSFDLAWRNQSKFGFDAGQGDFNFFSTSGSISGTVRFGRLHSRDYLVRLRLAGGSITGTSPISEEFEFGGDSLVRGMEEGERIARGFAGGSFEAGISVNRLLSFLGKESSATPAGSNPETTTTGQPRSVLPPQLSGAFLIAFVDYVKVTRSSSRSDDNSLGDQLKSFGAALDISLPVDGDRAASIQLGYAWSPESVEEGGRFFTAARFDF